MDVIDFFSSPIGLGHITRDIAIVNNFQNITTNFDNIFCFNIGRLFVIDKIKGAGIAITQRLVLIIL